MISTKSIVLERPAALLETTDSFHTLECLRLSVFARFVRFVMIVTV